MYRKNSIALRVKGRYATKGEWVNPRVQVLLVFVSFLALGVASDNSMKIQSWMNSLSQPTVLFSQPEQVFVARASETNMRNSAPTPAPLTNKWEEFVQAVDKVAPMYNFPKNVVLAQGALESARGTSKFAVERNNFLGIGAFDHNPSLANEFENAEQCVIEYMRLVRKNFPEAWENRDNPEKLLKLLVKNSRGKKYATDTAYVSKVSSMEEWGGK